MWENQREFLDPGFRLTKSMLLWPLGKGVNQRMEEFSFCLPLLAVTFFKILAKMLTLMLCTFCHDLKNKKIP